MERPDSRPDGHGRASRQGVYILHNQRQWGRASRERKYEPGWFGIWKPGTGLIEKHAMGLGDVTASLRVVSGLVFIVQMDRLAVFDVSTKAFQSEIDLGGPCVKLLPLAEGVLAAFTRQKVTWLDANSRKIIGSVRLEMGSFGAVATPDGRGFYFGSGKDLYLLEPKELWASRSR